jgi:fructuronate reductase
VMHEPFRQWVIEDRFAGGARPDLGAVGVQLVADVAPFELMKLRMLNGTHSSLAYLGYLAGHETIAGAVADPAFASLCRRLWRDEIIPTLAPPAGEDLGAYADALLTRYLNPAIRHRTGQIAMDGSQKLPQRLLGTIADNLAAGRPFPGLALAVAGWMTYVGGTDESGAPIDVRDPLADRLRPLAAGREPVEALLGLREVFPEALASDSQFRDAVAAAHATLRARGARAAVMELVG